LTNHRKRLAYILPLQQGISDIHGNDNIGSKLMGHIDRQVVGHASVHQQTPIERDGCIDARNAHAGADGFRQVATADDDFLAGFQIRGDCPEWNGQFIKILNEGGITGEFIENKTQVLAGDDTATQMQAVQAHTDAGGHGIAPALALAPDGLVGTPRVVTETGYPVHLDKALFNLPYFHTGGIECPNGRAGTGTHHNIHWHLQLFQHSQHTHMGHALGPAAA